MWKNYIKIKILEWKIYRVVRYVSLLCSTVILNWAISFDRISLFYLPFCFKYLAKMYQILEDSFCSQNPLPKLQLFLSSTIFLPSGYNYNVFDGIADTDKYRHGIDYTKILNHWLSSADLHFVFLVTMLHEQEKYNCNA